MSARDYINGDSVLFRPVLAIKIILVSLAILNSFIFIIKWILLVRVWENHVNFFNNNWIIYTEQPNAVYLVKLILIIILHDSVHKKSLSL